MLHETEGQRLLVAWLRGERGRSQDKAANLLGVCQQTISSYVAGRCRPTMVVRLRMHRILNVPADTWLTEDERLSIEASHPVTSALVTAEAAQ